MMVLTEVVEDELYLLHIPCRLPGRSVTFLTPRAPRRMAIGVLVSDFVDPGGFRSDGGIAGGGRCWLEGSP